MKRARWMIAGFAALVLLAALGVWSARVYREASRVRDLAHEMRASSSQGMKLDTLKKECALVSQMVIATADLRRDLAPLYPSLAWLDGKVPVAKMHYLGQAQAELELATRLSQAGAGLCQAGLPAAIVFAQDRSSPFGKAASLLAAQVGELQGAEDLLVQAMADAKKIDARYVPQAYQEDFKALLAALPAARQALVVLRELPEGLALVQEAQMLMPAGPAPSGPTLDNLPKIYDFAQRAADYSGRLQQDLAPLYPLLERLSPAAQKTLGPIRPALEYIHDLASAGALLGQAAQPLWQDAGAGQPKDGQFKLTRLLIDASAQADFSQAHALLVKAQAARAQIDPAQIPQPYQAQFVKLDGLLAQAGPALELLRCAPRLLGAGTPQTYLVMVQNRDELRATGGFVSAFGLARLDAGRLSMLEIDDSTQFDYVAEERQPPAPLGYIMQASYLVARDANWSPDFPTAAREMQEMYALSTDVPTDGAIAFDQGLLVDLLRFLGPLPIPEEGLTLDAGSVERVMVQYKQAAIAAGNPEGRKDFMALLAPALIKRMTSIADPKQQLALAKLLLEQVRSGHLQLYFKNTAAEGLLHHFELDGAVESGAGDYLMLVDSNVGFSKVDLFVERALSYRVDLSDTQKPAASVQLTYRLAQSGSEPCHQGVSEDTAADTGGYYFVRCYWDYWRLLLAPGAHLSSAAFDPVPPSYFDDGVGWKNAVEASAGENGTQQLAGLVVVPQGQTKAVTLETQLPLAVVQVDAQKRLVYTLRVQKQAGILQLPLEIRIRAPQGYRIFSSSDKLDYNQAENLYTWRGNLQEKKDFQILFEKTN